MNKGLALLGASTLTLGACTTVPEPFTPAELNETATSNFQRVDAEQEPVSAPIDLYEAMARSLKYNLDYKVELMEIALRDRELDLQRYDMLPQLVASAGYGGRNNFAGASSLSLITRRQSLEPSTSQERDLFTADLALSWDVLDFGLSYVRAKQGADEILIAQERRRKVANRVIEDVRSSYWRAVSAERLLTKLQELEGSVSTTLENSERLAERRLSAPLTALTYQRELLEIQAQIRKLQRELVVAKAQLAALMNLRPGTQFSLVLPDRTTELPAVQYAGEDMMMTALLNRPELREVSYRQRINSRELDAALLSALPSFRGILGVNVNSNDFLFNNNWVNYGAQASWNVLNLFRLPAHKKAVRAQDDLLEQRELALTMAVITQVHVSRARYGHFSQELETASRQMAVQDKILGQIRSGYKAGAMSRQTLLREEMNTLVSEVKYDIAYAEAQNAYANLFASMGIDEFAPDLTGQEDVATLQTSLAKLWQDREAAMKLSGQ
ncbi:TolC family protein [Erythrobacter sp. F6033]|uniref:TolC family protein n=1 Tax=Erythrobacter sp. F6033 TaxID=2926401 RepID=UPI001FF5567B|nr:TolC family protein [Erythrobacter sp. F6033]MCK0129259.1 TolC family protein [Erythrobacter sp. F6033]